MYVIVASGRVLPEHLEAFLASMKDDARGSVLDEPGCLRFDVLQDVADPARILLYEIYRDHAAFEQHLVQPHFLRWVETVKDWYLEPMAASFAADALLTEDIKAGR